MARNNLTPTLIVDKNGKPTTVHKKNARASTLPGIPSPVPDMKSRKEREDMARGLSARVIDLIGEDTGRFDTGPKRLMNLLGKTHSVKFVRNLVPLLAEDTDESRGVARQIAGGADEFRIGETRYFYERMPGIDYRDLTALVASLRDYRLTMPADLRDADEMTNRQNIGLMKVTDAIRRHLESQRQKPILITGRPGGGMSSGIFLHHRDDGPLRHLLTNLDGKEVKVLTEHALISLIYERPDDADKMVAVIDNHGLTTAREIVGVLEGVLPVLADGAL